MIYIGIIFGCVIGALVGMNAPIISYTYSNYLAIAIIAALDSVFGGVTSVIKKNFDLRIFLSGFFGNAILSIILTMLGEKLNVDIYLAAIIVFVGRMFTNLAIIRRYYVEKIGEIFEKSRKSNEIKNEEENESNENSKKIAENTEKKSKKVETKKELDSEKKEEKK